MEECECRGNNSALIAAVKVGLFSYAATYLFHSAPFSSIPSKKYPSHMGIFFLQQINNDVRVSLL